MTTVQNTRTVRNALTILTLAVGLFGAPALGQSEDSGSSAEQASDTTSAWTQLQRDAQAKLRSADDPEAAAREVMQNLVAFAEQHAEAPQSATAWFNHGVIASRLGEGDVAENSLSKAKEQAQDPRLRAAIESQLARIAVRPGAEPPAFEAQTLGGETVSPGDHEGKVVLIDFWATWCAPCLAEIPRLKRLHEEYHEEGLEIVSVSLDRQKEPWKRMIRDRGMGWTHIYNGSRQSGDTKGLATKYGVRGIPQMFVIGRDGRIVEKVRGGRPLEQAIERAIKQETEPKKPEQAEDADEDSGEEG